MYPLLIILTAVIVVAICGVLITCFRWSMLWPFGVALGIAGIIAIFKLIKKI